MRWALSRDSRKVLHRFVGPGTLLAFDFDGTLAPIVGDPNRARMNAATRRLLRTLAGTHSCVVLSGRSRRDLAGKLAGSGIRRAVGNHGAEAGRRMPGTRRQVALWCADLGARLAALPGLKVECKGLSLTVHYRHCRWKARARRAILDAARTLPGVRLIGGKEAISVVPSGAPDKGAALRAEMERTGCEAALYVGDDETDEDVFALRGGLRLLTIRVGRKAASGAQYYLRNQREIDELLRALLLAPRADRRLGPS